MKQNYDTVIVGKVCVLVPYRREHVLKYHQWMQDPDILEATCSEPLSLDEEYEMQASWRDDPKKCTFIVLAKSKLREEVANTLVVEDTLDAMAGDVNLFLSESDDDRPQGEIDIMIAETSCRRQGIGREATQLMLEYGVQKLKLERFFCRINESNTSSRNMFAGLQFVQCGYAECFQQYELEWFPEGSDLERPSLDTRKVQTMSQLD